MAEVMGSNPVQTRIFLGLFFFFFFFFFFFSAANYKVPCTTAIISHSLNTLSLSITNLKTKHQEFHENYQRRHVILKLMIVNHKVIYIQLLFQL